MGNTKKSWKDDLYYKIKEYFRKMSSLEKWALLFNFGVGYIFIAVIKPEWISPWYWGLIISTITFMFLSIFIICSDFVYDGKEIFNKGYNLGLLEAPFLIFNFVFANVLIFTLKIIGTGKFYVPRLNIQLGLDNVFFVCYAFISFVGAIFVVVRLLIDGLRSLVKWLIKTIWKQ